MKSIFVCDYCGKKFVNDSFRCKIHEEECEKNPVRWILIRVTCDSAIKDTDEHLCCECRDDWCVNEVCVLATDVEKIKENNLYDYVNVPGPIGFYSGYRTYTSVKNPDFSFKAKYK